METTWPDGIAESDQDSTSAAATPLARSAELPAVDPMQYSPPHASFFEVIANAGNNPAKTNSPPSSPSEPSQQMYSLSLQTPPRRPSLQTSKLEFLTPSPPKNLPDLPGPPSEDDTDPDIDNDRTPVNPNQDNDFLGNLTAMKTPKPPGAWMVTPPPAARDPPPRPSSTPPERTPPPSNPAFATPGPSSLSRSSSMPMQTPAPPGAWAPTPGGSLRKKSILKVRFDVEPGDLSSDSMVAVPVVGPPLLKPLNGINVQSGTQSSRNSEARTTAGTPNGFAKPSLAALQEAESSAEMTPTKRTSTLLPQTLPAVAKPVRSPKAPSVRVLDAFGRETSNDEPPEKVEEDSSLLWQPVDQNESQEGFDTPVPSGSRSSRHKASNSSPPRSKGSIRIVDALGREIIEDQEATPTKEKRKKASSSRRKRESRPVEEVSDEFVMPATHNEALVRVREVISHLAEDLDEVDR